MRAPKDASGTLVTLALRLFLLGSLIGCNLDAPPDLEKRIPECVAYEAAASSCYQRELSIADQPAMNPKDREGRARIAALCRENLQNLTRGCR
jgi:hypothetical protein